MQHGGPEHGDALLRHAHNAEPDTHPDDSGADSPWCHTRTDAYAHNGHAQVALRWIIVSCGTQSVGWRSRAEPFTVAALRALVPACTTFVPA